jgi:gliding motility-associated-like protein
MRIFFTFLVTLFLTLFPGCVFSQFLLNGSATKTGPTEYQLTPKAGGKMGSIWNAGKIDLTKSFDVVFDAYFGDRDAGADGMTFTIQQQSTNAGSPGAGLGAGGITPSLIVEFDTYQNGGDPSYDHIGISKNGVLNHSLVAAVQASSTSANIEDNQFHKVTVKWDAPKKELTVYFDCVLRATYTNDIVQSIFGNNPNVYWGFTAATGGAFNEHKIAGLRLGVKKEVQLCNGDATQVALDAGLTFLWTPNTGLSANNIANPMISPNSSTKYIVEVTEACTGKRYDTVNVTVNNKPIVNLGNDTTVCGASSITLTATGGGTYLWSTNSTSSSISVNSSGNYSVEVTSANGCKASDQITVKINEPALCPCANDNDNDGVCDDVDLDADNDGILNVNECMTSNFKWSAPPNVNGKTATGVINGINYTYTSSINIQTTSSIYSYGTFPGSYNVPNTTVIRNDFVSNNKITFSTPVLNPTLLFSSIGGQNSVPISFSNPVDVLFQSGPVTVISPTKLEAQEGYVILRMNGTFSEISFDYLADETYVNFTFGADFATFCDTDSDGIPNYLDTDSDGDACTDAVEGGSSFKNTDLSGQSLAGSVDANGVPVVATASGQTIGSSIDVNVKDVECCIPPTVSTSDTKVCVGASITASPTTDGTWTSSNTTAATISNAGVITGVSAGTATFTFTNTGGCSSTTNTVTVNTKPQVTLIDAEICAGDPAATFDAGAGFASYAWSDNGSGNLQTTSGTNTGAYTVIVADANGCKDTASANLALKTNCGCVNDNDKDGVCDEDDLDDDNDGILDVVECMDNSASWDFETPVVGAGNNNQGTTFQGWTCTGGGWINLIHPPYGGAVPQTASSGNQYVEVGGTGDFSRVYTVASAGVVTVEIDFASWGNGTEQTQLKIFKADGTTLVAQSAVVTTPPPADWNNAWQNTARVSAHLEPGSYVIKFFLGNFQAFDNVKISSANVSNCDTDNDGIVNTLDTDSDGDGCADAVEGGASFKKSDLTNDALSGAVDANGVPVVAGTAGQSVGTSANSLSVDVDCACAKPAAPTIDGSSSQAIHSFDFNAQQELNETTPVFENGKKYQYKVTGTWSVWTNDPTKNALDAAFRYADNMTGAPLGSPFANGYVKLDGNTFPRPDTNVYKANHEYWYSFTGQGQALNFTFTDSPYSDNHGSLQFTFYAPADTIKVCANSSTKTLSDYVSGTNLLWYTSATGSTGSATSPQVNNAVEAVHSYWVTQTVNGCESDRTPLFYKVVAKPTLNLGSDALLCEGESITITAPLAKTYLWSNGSASNAINVSAAGNYSVEIINESGCKNADTIAVNFKSCITNYIEKDTLFICRGDSIEISGKGIIKEVWTGTDAFNQLNDSTIKVSPAKNAIYCIGDSSGYTRGTNIIVNGNFESGSGVGFTVDPSCSEVAATAGGGNNQWSIGNGVQWTGWAFKNPNQPMPLPSGVGGKIFYMDGGQTPNIAIYRTQVSVVAGNSYEFSAYVSNIFNDQFPCSPAGPPELRFAIDGEKLSYITGLSIHEQRWTQFNTTWNSTKTGTINIELLNNNSAGCGNDFAIDAIEFVPIQYTSQNVKDSVIVIVYDLPALNLGRDTTICASQSIKLDAGNATKYLWNTAATSKTIDVNTAGNFSVEVVDANGCKAGDDIFISIDPCLSDFIAKDTLTICKGDSVLISATNVSTQVWSGTDVFRKINDSTIKVSPTGASAIYKIGNESSYSRGTNAISNGDFEQGATGFTSQYVLQNAGLNQGGYVVGTNAQNHNGVFSACGDHTSGSGKMFITDASTQANVKVWCQTISTAANTKYEFAAWVTSVYAPNPPILQFSVNGSALGSAFNVGATTCNWQEFAATWNSGATTSAEICLINQNTAGSGNDFAIDDITFSPVIPHSAGGDSVLVIVKDKPSVELGSNKNICEGDSVVLDAGVASTYQWNKGEITKNITVKTTGDYSVEITASNGCKAADTINVKVNTKPNVVLNNAVICEGDAAVTFDAGAGFSSYAWSDKGTGSNQTVSGKIAGNYTVQVADANGCKDTSSATLTVNAKPNVVLNNAVICEGDAAVTFDAGAGYSSFEWSENGSGNTQTFSGKTAGNYTVKVADAKGCKDTATALLTVNTKPNVVLSNDTICEGDAAVTFDAGAGYSSYEWTENGTGNSQTFSGKIAGNYTVKVSDANGCKDTSSATLIVNTKPNVVIANAIICDGDAAATFDAGTGFYSYAWSDKGTGISQTTTGKTAGTYTVQVVDVNGCKDTSSATLTVNAKPNVVLNNAVICEGDAAVTFDAGAGYSSYEWTENGTGNSQTFSGKIAGNYTVKVAEANGCKDTSSATLIVNTKPNVVIANAIICEGDAAATFDAGAGFSSYVWSDKGTGSNQTVNGKIAGNYTVQVADANGCKDTSSATLTVNAKPNVVLNSAVICEGDAAVTFDAGAGYSSYEWSENGSGNTQTFNGIIAGNYTVKVVDAKGCKDTATAALTVNAKPNVVLSNAVICEGDAAVTFDAGAGYSSYVWSDKGTGNSQTTSGSADGNYTVKVVDTKGCKDTATAILKVNKKPIVNFSAMLPICKDFPSFPLKGATPFGGIYEVEHGTTWQQDSVFDVASSSNGNYNIRYTYVDSNTCANTASISLVVNDLPKLKIPDQVVCEGEMADFDAGSNFKNYSWSTGSNLNKISTSKDGVYSITVTDFNGCKTKDTMVLKVNSLPIVELGDNQKICDGEMVTLQSTTEGSSYLWNDGSSNKTLEVKTSGKYSLSITDTNSCVGKDEVEITVIQFPKVNLGSDQEICEGQVASLSISDSKASYYWSSSEKESTIAVATTQSIILTQYNDVLCLVRDTVNIIVIPYPKSELGNDTTVCFTETFDGALILDAGVLADSYLWDNGSTSSSISIDAKGTYSVSLTNGKSCTIEDQIVVNTLCKTSLFCPTAFTPNNDGTNDIFYVIGANVDKFQLLIFNRWGDIIFESNDMSYGWDGTVNDNKVQQDVYVVKIIYSVNGVNGYQTKEQIISTLALIR